MTQAPTPGPLSGDDVKLLVAQGWHENHGGRPHATGADVDVIHRSGRRFRFQPWMSQSPWDMTYDSVWSLDRKDTATGALDPIVCWKPHGEMTNEGEAVMQKLRNLVHGAVVNSMSAPTAPVEASGSEREDTFNGDDAALVASITALLDLPDSALSHRVPGLAKQLLASAASRLSHHPQPSGETRPTDEELRSAIKATEYKYFGDYEFSEEQHAAVDVLVRAAQALLSTPARAEAQDEGAAGEPWGYVSRRIRVEGESCEGPWTSGKIGDGFYMLTVDDPEWETVTLYAHPSPTPAADADRVREAIGKLEWRRNARELSAIKEALDTQVQGKRAEYKARVLSNALVEVDYDALCVALAALKSTAAK